MTAHDLEAKQADVALDPMAGTMAALNPQQGTFPATGGTNGGGLEHTLRGDVLGAVIGDFDRGSNLARAHVSPVVLVLPYPISANRYWTSFQLGKRIMTAPSAEAKAYKRQVAQLVKAQGVRQPLTGRVRIDLKLYPNRPQDWQRRQRKDGQAWDDTVQCLDLDNARKVVYDSLKGLVIEDDKWVRQDTGERMEPDEHGARLVITVTPLPVSRPQTELFGAVEQEAGR